MADGPQIAMLPDGRRLHLQHGPIDLIIEAWGAAAEVAAAYGQAARAFADVLIGLVGELARLKQPIGAPRWLPHGPVARRMVAACWPHREVFITPMAAVAGAVADHVLAAMIEGRVLHRAYVNDGGDIAFFLAPGERLTAGLVADVTAYATLPKNSAFSTDILQSQPRATPSLSRRERVRAQRAGEGKRVNDRAPWHYREIGAAAPHPPSASRWVPPCAAERIAFGVAQPPGEGDLGNSAPLSVDGTIELTSDMPVRGLATSGRAAKGQGGRSFSLGIADAVSVLAADAAAADAAATIIANAVTIGHSAIRRLPACEIDPDSDLGDRLVTIDVGPLSDGEIATALRAGVERAESLRRAGLIHGAVLVLRRHYAVVGGVTPRLAAA